MPAANEVPEGDELPATDEVPAADQVPAADEIRSSGETPTTNGASAVSETDSEIETNSFFDGLITPGVDVRVQMVKLGRPPRDTVRKAIPMQPQLNPALTPAD